jgi:hypothetical protein
MQLIAKIKSEQAVLFFRNIIHRFGVLNSIITYKDRQFMGKKILRFCDEYHIRVDWAAMAHPHMNGQVKHANDMVL